jgi:hypothetical protein
MPDPAVPHRAKQCHAAPSTAMPDPALPSQILIRVPDPCSRGPGLLAVPCPTAPRPAVPDLASPYPAPPGNASPRHSKSRFFILVAAPFWGGTYKKWSFEFPS